MRGCRLKADPRFTFHASRFLETGRARRRWSRIVRCSRTVNVGQAPMSIYFSASCEPALLERLLKVEAMVLWSVRSAHPNGVLQLLRRYEEEEAQHLKEFESRLGVQSHGRKTRPFPGLVPPVML